MRLRSGGGTIFSARIRSTRPTKPSNWRKRQTRHNDRLLFHFRCWLFLPMRLTDSAVWLLGHSIPFLPDSTIFRSSIAVLSVVEVREWSMRSALDVPLYLREPFIVRGYRPESHAIGPCLTSVFQWHNQTCDIWSHLLGFLSYLLLGIHYFRVEHKWVYYLFVDFQIRSQYSICRVLSRWELSIFCLLDSVMWSHLESTSSFSSYTSLVCLFVSEPPRFSTYLVAIHNGSIPFCYHSIKYAFISYLCNFWSTNLD